MNYESTSPKLAQSQRDKARMSTKRLSVSADEITQAATLLREGGLVAFPTETVYGLGADGTNPAAVAKIYAAKGRPTFNPLIAHVPNVDAAFSLGEFPTLARKLAMAFWPGPLTLVVPIKQNCAVCDLARAGLMSIALRVPAHTVAQALLQAAGCPIVAPSANRSGHISPTLASHVLHDLDGVIDAILMGDDATIGLESTILAVMGDHITLLRPGAITREDVVKATGHPVHLADARDGASPLSPGRLASHYAPHARLRLNATHVEAGEACLAFGDTIPEGASPALTRNLSQKSNLTEAAANLYRNLRELDALNPTGICVAPLPETGLGEAIKDRLTRAAAPNI